MMIQIKSTSLGVKILLPVLLSLVVAVSFCSCVVNNKNENQHPSGKLTLLFFNDFHGHLMPFSRFYKDKHFSGGIARMASLIKSVENENKNSRAETLVLSGGDNLQGTPMSTAYRGEAEIKAFNAMGLDATVIGNHDFDFGYERLLELKEMAKFPILSANIYQINNSDLAFLPYVLRRLPNGLTVGIIGLSTIETPITTHPLNVEALRFSRPELAMQRYIDVIDSRTDVIVVLSHLGVDTDKEIARMYPEVDVILGGHTHTKLAEPIFIGKTMICQTGDNGVHLGRLDLDVKNDRATMIRHDLMPVAHYVKEDAEVKALMDDYHDRLDAEISKVIGTAENFLDGERPKVRKEETNLGDLIADLMRLRTNADVALINSGAIRSSINKGEVKFEDVIRAFPMNNQLISMDISGQDLYLILSQSARLLISSPLNHPSGGFLQVSGVSFKINNKGGIEDLKVKGKAIKLVKTYKIVTLDFLASGGDGYRILKNAKNKYDTGITLQDTLIEYFKKHGSVSAKKDGRIAK